MNRRDVHDGAGPSRAQRGAHDVAHHAIFDAQRMDAQSWKRAKGPHQSVVQQTHDGIAVRLRAIDTIRDPTNQEHSPTNRASHRDQSYGRSVSAWSRESVCLEIFLSGPGDDNKLLGMQRQRVTRCQAPPHARYLTTSSLAGKPRRLRASPITQLGGSARGESGARPRPLLTCSRGVWNDVSTKESLARR
jgi:hypothetical protein